MQNNPSSPLSPTSPISPVHSISSTITERCLSISTQSQGLPSPTQTPTQSPTGENFHPQFVPLLRHLAARLTPLVNCTTGQKHPDFPANLLAYNLLTHEKCDALSRHFHQVWPPVKETANYPVPIRPWVGSQFESLMDLDTKRRRIGQFIGLQGCESPVYEAWEDYQEQDVDMEMDVDTEMEDTLQEMQEEWEEALKMAWRDEGHRWSQK